MTEQRALPRGYELVRTLGAGGFGEVLLARQTGLNRMVAIKRIHGYALSAPEEMERFRREARVLATLDHPAIVSVYDFRREGNDAALVMQYVPGSSLAERLEGGRLPAAEALVVLGDVASALQAAAQRGIAHRDVKPGNVFVLPDGRAKLGDFGIARVVSDSSVFRTADGSASGTPAYFPPETGLVEPDARGDAYSFAVMAYEALTGHLPFEGRGALQMITAHMTEQPPAPELLLPGFPALASAALLAGLAKDPAARPLPHELVARLASVPADSWPPPPPREQTPDGRDRSAPTIHVGRGPDRPPTGVPAALAPVAARTQPRRRLVWGAAAVILVAAAAGIFYGRPQSSPPPPIPLEVLTVEIATTPTSGRTQCPSGMYTFTATLTTNGGPGTVQFQWTQPDGRTTPTTELAVVAGQRQVSAVLRFDVTGERPLRGRALLRILLPRQLAVPAADIVYACPGTT